MLCAMKHTARPIVPMTLLALRDRSGLTQVEFAPLAGINRSRLSKIERRGSPRIPATTFDAVTANLRRNKVLLEHEVVSFVATE